MKKLTLLVTTLLLLAVAPNGVFAETCTTSYGGGVVCGVETPPKETLHTPVNTAEGDINPAVVAGSLVALSLGSFYLYRKTAL